MIVVAVVALGLIVYLRSGYYARRQNYCSMRIMMCQSSAKKADVSAKASKVKASQLRASKLFAEAAECDRLANREQQRSSYWIQQMKTFQSARSLPWVSLPPWPPPPP
jgi:hypothetical protein